MNKRVLLKISGEQLAGNQTHGIDVERAKWLAEQVKAFAESNVQLVIMIGGGNLVRGAEVAGGGIKNVTGDHMGMLATLINAIALTDIFETCGIKTRCLSNIFAPQVSESFSHRLVEKHLSKNRVVLLAGGLGRPYFTTDTAAVNLALELECEVVYKATKVDGVYDKDPSKYDDAIRFESLKYDQAVKDANIRVMDKAAMALAMEHDLRVVVFDAYAEGKIRAAAAGEPVGTTIS